MLNASVLDRYPKVDIAAVQALLEEKCREDRHKIIVLDDDPTGVQTVHDISVYTDWSYDSIKRGFEEKGKLFYILTNSRGFTVEHTTRAHLEIGETAAKVSEETGIDYVIVSRGSICPCRRQNCCCPDNSVLRVFPCASFPRLNGFSPRLSQTASGCPRLMNENISSVPKDAYGQNGRVTV